MNPQSLETLIDQGVIHRVVRPLMSGKEAQVFLVEIDGVHQVAKIYKTVHNRSFKHRAEYMEGRRMRNTRSQRAVSKRSRFGRAQEEEAWKNAEVDAIYRLQAAGVRVPAPLAYEDGVLVMELVADADGEPAPRLVDIDMERDEAEATFHQIIREVVKMLCAGLVHGDLSDFNVLFGADGPVIIDFPQAVDAARNRNARRLLVRDVRNLQSFFARWVPKLRRKQYGEEIWEIYEDGRLEPDTPLTGRAKKRGKADTDSVLREIQAAVREERARRAALGLDPLPEAEPIIEDPRIAEMRARAERSKQKDARKKKKRGRGGDERRDGGGDSRSADRPPPSEDSGGNRSRKRGRRKKKGGGERRETPPAADPVVARRPKPKKAKPKRASGFDDLDALLEIED